MGSAVSPGAELGCVAPLSPGGHRFEPLLAVSTSDAVQPYLIKMVRLLGLLLQPAWDVMLQMSLCLSGQRGRQPRADRLAFVQKVACVTRPQSPCSWAVVQPPNTCTGVGWTGGEGSPAVGPVLYLSPLLSAVFHPVSGNAEGEKLLLFIVPVIWGRKAFTVQGRGPGCR